jgi:hypothetical protein
MPRRKATHITPEAAPAAQVNGVSERGVETLLRNPVKLFTGEEIAAVMEVPVSWVVAARRAGAPFPGGRSRPEWVLEWLLKNPDFTLKAFRD